MSDAMLAKVAGERTQLEGQVRQLGESALAEKRDLTTSELEIITRAKDRLSELDKQVEVLARESKISEDAAARLSRISAGVSGGVGKVEYRSAAEFLHDFLASQIGQGDMKRNATERIQAYQRSAAHITTGDLAGIIPDVVIGPIINTINARRPLTNALGTLPTPAGVGTFRRPRIVDPNADTGMGFQANQKDELASQPFQMTSSEVSLTTLGGYVNVARQILDWGVASMDQIVMQLAVRYSRATERAVVAEMNKSTGHIPLAVGADSATTLKAFYDAAAAYYAATAELPEYLVAGPMGWARLGSLVDSVGRAVFPFLAPSNASGGTMRATDFVGNPVGLTLVVTPGITTEDYWVTGDEALEVYEQVNGQLSVVEPSVLGTQVSYSGYLGTFSPVPDASQRVGV